MTQKDFKKLDIKTRKLVNNMFLGNYKSSFKGRGLEFSDFRNYEYGDDAKHIDWLVSAREGKTIIRKYEEERELNILFLLDLSTSMTFGLSKEKIETLKEIFFLIALSAIENNDRVGAILFGLDSDKLINFKKGKSALFNIIKEIDKYKEDFEIHPRVPSLDFPSQFTLNSEGQMLSGTKLDLTFLNKSKIKNSLVFILSDKLEIDEKQFIIANKKNELIYINIFDSFENTLEKNTGIMSLGDSKKDIKIDLDDKVKKKEYTLLRKKKIDRFKHILQKKEIDYLYIDETKNIYKELIRLMRNREG